MIISALYRYYGCLKKMDPSPLIDERLSSVRVTYLICLNDEGEISDIISLVEEREGKKYPKMELFPRRSEKPGIDSNFVESRPLYIFGLEVVKSEGNPHFEVTKKAKKSHDHLIGNNFECYNEIDSRLAGAVYKFFKKWQPENELENKFLLRIITKYSGAYFTFALQDDINKHLNTDEQVLDYWFKKFAIVKNDKEISGQCAICGEIKPIARIHDNLRGIPGGQPSGVNIVCCKEDSSWSYGLEQGYVASVSEEVMKGYTAAFNYLASNPVHKKNIGNTTFLFWAETSKNEELYCEFFKMLSDSDAAYEKDENISGNIKSALEMLYHGKKPDLNGLGIDEDTDFFVLSVVPNASRLMIKSFDHNKFGNIVANVSEHCENMRLSEGKRIPSIFRVMRETSSPNSSNRDKEISPSLFVAYTESIMKGTMYPANLLAAILRRIRTDQDTDKNTFIKVNDIRVSFIKAYLCRNYKIKQRGESVKMGLDVESKNPAYLCGRLFAVLEKLQKEANNATNSTIKTSYFASACSTPAIVMPKILRLAQYHLAKLDNSVYYDKIIGSIMAELGSELPKTLNIEEQGRFILGYYQQNQKLYEKKEN